MAKESDFNKINNTIENKNERYRINIGFWLRNKIFFQIQNNNVIYHFEDLFILLQKIDIN